MSPLDRSRQHIAERPCPVMTVHELLAKVTTPVSQVIAEHADFWLACEQFYVEYAKTPFDKLSHADRDFVFKIRERLTRAGG